VARESTCIFKDIGCNVHDRICPRVSPDILPSYPRDYADANDRLGDRHGENILFDSLTGDTVHVDLNCLFDKVSPALPSNLNFMVTSAKWPGQDIRDS